MSFNSRYHADKENALRESRLNNKLKNSITQDIFTTSVSENATGVKSKTQTLRPGAKRGLRQPLRGKDQNRTVPSLQRSKTSLNSPQDTKFVKVPLSKKPLLSKANSSLGFTPTDNSLNNIINYDTNQIPTSNNTIKSQPIEFKNISLQEVGNDIFENGVPARSKVLVEPASTDSLIKSEISLKNEPTKSLSTTISPRTETLNSTYLDDAHLMVQNVDPIKRSPKRKLSHNNIPESNKSRRSVDITPRPFHIPKDFIESEEEIEYVPTKKPELPYTPVGIEPLNNDDLQFISKKKNRNISVDHNPKDILNLDDELNDLSVMMDSDNENFDMNVTNNDILDSGNIGLHIDDLNALLDI